MTDEAILYSLEEVPSDVEELDLTHEKIQRLESMQRFSRLKKLYLRQNLLFSLTFLSLNQSLEELDLYDNRLGDMSKVANLVHLKWLDLSFNNIEKMIDFSPLAGSLSSLYLASNLISAISGLSQLSNLRVLELGANHITEIDGLDGLPQLEELWLGKNRIRDIKGLESLKSLKKLSLQSNRLTQIQGLSALVSLEELYLSHNQISGTLQGFDTNLELRVLDVSHNRLTCLSGIAHLSSLAEFWANHNQFADYSHVEGQLKGLRQLATVYFEGNPLQTAQPAVYRSKLRYCLPNSIRQIDALLVKPTAQSTLPSNDSSNSNNNEQAETS